MDRKIEKSFIDKYKTKLSIGLGAIAFVFLLQLFGFDGKQSFRIDRDMLQTYTVTSGSFEDFIPIKGRSIPIKTIYLDAISGGQVEELFVEDGAFVQKGDPILTLANTTLLLDVMQREAQLFEQENQLRNTRLLFEQNKLQLEERLSFSEYNILKSRREFKRNEQLYKKELISRDELEGSQEDYDFQLRQKQLVTRSILKDSLFRLTQIRQLENSVKRLTDNFKVVKGTLDKLTVRAPIAGQLTSLNLELGQSVRSGNRIAQVDVLSGYKVEAFIDEHYLSKLNKGFQAEGLIGNEVTRFTIEKIYPLVENGRVKIDLKFNKKSPESVKRGQRLQLKLSLGESLKSILLKRGQFYNSTNGAWVFVLSEDGSKAVRREIKTGRQNPKYYEIKSGLSINDIVITSSYESFGNAEQLIIE